MAKKQILVVDDEEILTRTFVRLLEKSGYDAFFVKSGADAVEIVKDVDFDLVICDMRMPGMNGYETIKGMREAYALQRRQHPPEVIVTGYADSQLEAQVKELKPAVYLYKPFDINELLQNVKRLVT